MQVRVIKDSNKWHIYSLEFPFEWETVRVLQSLKEEVGWKALGFTEGKWRFTDIALVEKMKAAGMEVVMDTSTALDFASTALRDQEKDIRIKRLLELKDSTDTSFRITGIKKPELPDGTLAVPYPYQNIGVEFMETANGRCILADDQGLGKTLQILGYAAHAGLEKVLITCLASNKFVWEDECKRWTYLKPCVITSKTIITPKLWGEYDVFIINYDIVYRHLESLKSMRIDLLAGDEATALKNPTAQRTNAVRELARHARHVIMASGTPILNRPAELFSLLNMVDPQTWHDRWRFLQRYCGAKKGYWGWEFKGATNIEELKGLITTIFIRRTKTEVLKDLPERTISDVPVELDPVIMKKYALAEADFTEYARSYKGKSYASEAMVKLGELRQLASLGKIDSAIEFIDNLLEGNEKVIVFSNYQEPLRILRGYYEKDSVFITGEISPEERGPLVRRFREDPDCRVFLGGIHSTGMGLTLTEATATVFLDFAWRPADHAQAQDRNYRIGQKQAVNVYYLFAKGTIDEKMKWILHGKRKIFEALFEKAGSDDQQETMIKELVNSYGEDLTSPKD